MSLAEEMGIDKKVALLSVYHKDGIVEFAQGLVDLGWKLIASGGTAKALKDAGLEVQDVAELVGGQAIFGHRVVTLSREVYAALLCTETEEDLTTLKELGLPWIDLVCVDFYPLEEEIANPEATIQSVIEKTDIGGPTLLRAAAKGRRIVIGDPQDRPWVLERLTENFDTDQFRQHLAAKAESIVARYVQASADYHSKVKLA